MKRTVPHSVETEQAVLGSLLVDPALADEITGISTDFFFTPAHASVWSAIASIRAENGIANLVSVTQRLEADGALKSVGGAGALSEMLAKSAGGVAAVEYHVQTLRDLHARRRIIDAALAMQSSAQDLAADAEGVLQSAGESVLSLSLTQSTDSMRSSASIVPALTDELERVMTGKNSQLGLGTGFWALDKMTGGLRGGQLTIVAGRPAMGKSAFMVNMADRMVRAGDPVVYFSLEMQANELGTRIVLSRAGVDTEMMRNGFLNPADTRKIAHELQKFGEEPFYIDDRGGLSLLDIRSRGRLAVRRWGVKAIFVDYLQLVSHSGANSRENEVGFVSRGLKAMSMELGIPVVAAAQVNRQAEQRSDNRPKLSDLRESGSIEQDADLVLLLHRPCYYATGGEDASDPQDAELIIAKHRAGRTGSLPMTWSPRLTRFDTVQEGRTTDQPSGVYAPSTKLWEALNE